MNITKRDQIIGGIMGLAIGDALGLPVEGRPRQSLAESPIKGMTGWGSYCQPPGTWSDDTSMTLATMSSLITCGALDTDHLARQFARWLYNGEYTPFGVTFDVGGITREAIGRLSNGVPAELAGGNQEADNGNGSLMRVLPVALRFATDTDHWTPQRIAGVVHRASSITHRCARSLLACSLYGFMVHWLMNGYLAHEAYQKAIQDAESLYFFTGNTDARNIHQLELRTTFARFMSGKLGDLGAGEIKSHGYVVDTLEAAVWCLLNTATYKSCVLKAVNLGHDADTTAAVAGGLAGILYGDGRLGPANWERTCIKSAMIRKMAVRFADICPIAMP